MKSWQVDAGGRALGREKLGRKDEIRRRIRLKVVMSTIPPGAPLDEEALADEFGVSRTPIREICAHLVAEGTAEYHRGRGACVPDITAAGIEAFFEAATGIFPATFRQTALRADPYDLSLLRRLLEAAEAVADLDTPDLYVRRYLDFMEHCAETSRNPYLARTAKQMIREHTRICIAIAQIDRRNARPIYDPRRDIDDCRVVLRQLERRDADALLSHLGQRLAESEREIGAALIA
ncbi:MAG: GntR family transcriptional regulator [Pseudomonadota bacterium]